MSHIPSLGHTQDGPLHTETQCVQVSSGGTACGMRHGHGHTCCPGPGGRERGQGGSSSWPSVKHPGYPSSKEPAAAPLLPPEWMSPPAAEVPPNWIAAGLWDIPESVPESSRTFSALLSLRSLSELLSLDSPTAGLLALVPGVPSAHTPPDQVSVAPSSSPWRPAGSPSFFPPHPVRVGFISGSLATSLLIHADLSVRADPALQPLAFSCGRQGGSPPPSPLLSVSHGALPWIPGRLSPPRAGLAPGRWAVILTSSNTRRLVGHTAQAWQSWDGIFVGGLQKGRGAGRGSGSRAERTQAWAGTGSGRGHGWQSCRLESGEAPWAYECPGGRGHQLTWGGD